MTRYKYENGIRKQLTAEEETARDAEEQAWSDGEFDREINKLRNRRNDLLAETDWMANSDVTMNDDWKTYRQELRDLPSGLDTVEKIKAKKFPTKPGE
jgi:hypothetical protein